MHAQTTSGARLLAADRSRRGLRKRLIAVVAVTILGFAGVILNGVPAYASVDSLHGQITAGDTHAGIPNAQVQIFGSTNFLVGVVHTDANGFYSFSSIPADGDYILSANSDLALTGYGVLYFGSTIFRQNATHLTLTSSSNLQASIELPVSGGISGNVTSSVTSHSPLVSVYSFDSITNSWKSVANSSFALGTWEIDNLVPGTYTVGFSDSDSPSEFAEEFYDNVATVDDATVVTVTAGNVTPNVNADLESNPPVTVKRYGGADRFKTSALIAETYSSANIVFVANGLGYPDALSAAPAAAFFGGPLLLTEVDSLSAEVKAQIVRLQPQVIAVIGGTGVVSAAVFNELSTLAPNIGRVSGADRYATSQAVFTNFWDSVDATTVFLADGRNYPDALASASAAGNLAAPVVLVDGGSQTLPAGFPASLVPVHTSKIVLAGGTAVMSAGIESAAAALPFITVSRYFGSDRYATSWAINNATFTTSTTVYLAVGSGFADALAGAALAGGQGAPLYLVPGNCVPQNVLDSIHSLGATSIVLLGGTGVLSAAVEALTPCGTS